MVLFSITAGVLILPKFRSEIKPTNECLHSFEKTDFKSPEEFEPGYIIYKCLKCNEEKTERINSKSMLPQISFNSSTEGINKDSEVLLNAEYVDDEITFQTYASLKYQGHTAMLYDKKNYTVKFYEDENKDKKNKVSIHGWKESNKYCLKANYIDFSQSRNIVSANIWRDVVASRKHIDKNIAELQNYGAIDGYPIMVFINDKYQGIYTMNIPKDDDTYNIGDDEGLLIEVLPFISPDGYVSLNITPEFSTIKTQAPEYTLLQRRDLELKNIRIKDGETLVLAGLIKEGESQKASKMPFLSDLPFIGAFFRQSSNTKTREELVIVVTPHIIKDADTNSNVYDL